MYTINNNSLMTGYIKQLLHEFNLPKAKVLFRGDMIFKDIYYIFNNKLYLCTKNSIFGGSECSTITATYVNSKGQTVYYLQEITTYIYGDKYLNITKQLELNNTLYDSYTHKYLGNYLRFYRDFKHINLMSLYNCFCGDIGKNIDINITDNSKIISFNSNDTKSVIYLVPVKFFKEYTIGIDCSSTIELMACLYDNQKIIDEYISSASLNYLYKNTYMRIGGCRFNKPFKYSKLLKLLNNSGSIIDINKIYNQEKNLTLLIKVPLTNKSSITVLEGDYTDSSTGSITSGGYSLNVYGNRLASEELDRNLDWYSMSFDANNKFIGFSKELDSTVTYYTDSACTIKLTGNWKLGRTYYLKRGSAPYPTIVVSNSTAYYSFKDSIQSINYYINSNINKHYYLTYSDFPSEPKSIWLNDLFIDESTGMAYRFKIDAYEPLYTTHLDGEDTLLGNYSRHYNSKLQLLYANDNISYVFADKLIGYLLQNVITSDDKITDNIRRLQKTLIELYGIQQRSNIIGINTGLWNDYLRDLVYDIENNYGVLNNSFDSIGFVDKDIEKYLGESINHDTIGHGIQGGIN